MDINVTTPTPGSPTFSIAKWGTIGGIVLVLLWLFSWIWGHVNMIPAMDENVKAKWSQVLNQYQRRADMVPNLVATVKGYAAHEKETLEAVIKARASATQMTIPENILTNPKAFKEFQDKQDTLAGTIARLMMLQERYPDLKANQNFLALQSQLEGTENRIAVARQDYIVSVQGYNTEVRTFPGRIVAMFYGVTPKEIFTIAESKQEVPTVNFDHVTPAIPQP